jgi:peptidoglycan hydrolase-like protein with peptidoglycan-binding domain
LAFLREFGASQETLDAVAASLGGSQVPLPAGNAPLSLARDRQLRDRGDDILLLQRWLNAGGFIVASEGPGSPGQEVEDFGILTYLALMRFQESRGLPATGFLGPLTRAAIAGAR